MWNSVADKKYCISQVLTWMYLHFNVSLDYSKAGPMIQSNDEFALF